MIVPIASARSSVIRVEARLYFPVNCKNLQALVWAKGASLDGAARGTHRAFGRDRLSQLHDVKEHREAADQRYSRQVSPALKTRAGRMPALPGFRTLINEGALHRPMKCWVMAGSANPGSADI